MCVNAFFVYQYYEETSFIGYRTQKAGYNINDPPTEKRSGITDERQNF